MKHATPRVLLVDDDVTTLASARHALADSGVEVVEAASVDEARRAIAREWYAAAIVDVRLGTEDGLALVRELRAASQRFPIVVLSSVTEFTEKIEAMRAGADAYFEKPVDWFSFSRSVRALVETASRSARILIVDDDPVSTQVLRRTLESAGYEVSTCSQAERFEKALHEAHPDLILMDIDLPNISGLELARYVRQDERFETVPLLYITGSTRDQQALAVDAADGEQILHKPVPTDLLLSTVAGRLGHFLRLRRLMDRDPLSGVLMRRPFLERVDEVIAAFRRAPGRHYTLTLLDLDHFKQINDRYGHAAGDRVIASLGETLRRGTRTSDAVGRYGGEEFAILVADSDAEGTSHLIERLLDEFGAIRHTAPTATVFSVTFSAGVAQIQAGESTQSWLARADVALYEAKAAGRNRVWIAEGSAEDAIDSDLDEATIAGLRELAEVSGHDIVGELTELFLSIAPERIAAMRDAIANRDGEMLRQAAHALRSAAGNIGATAMHLCCVELEAAGAAARWEKAEPEVARLAEAYTLTSAALTRLAVR